MSFTRPRAISGRCRAVVCAAALLLVTSRARYWEDEELWDIAFDVLAHREDRLRVRWTASPRDVNHLDRTMRVEVDAWFQLEEE